MASVSSLRSKCFGAFSEQRMRNKKSTVSERVGRSWSARKGGPLGSVGEGGVQVHPSPPLSTGLAITVNLHGNQLL